MYAIIYLPTATIVKYTRHPKRMNMKYSNARAKTAEGLKVLLTKKFEIVRDGLDIIIQPNTELKSAYCVPRHLVEIIEV